MFIYSSSAILLPNADGTERFFVSKGYVGEIPDWAAGTVYFQDLLKAGKISLPAGKKDTQVEAAVSAAASAAEKAADAETAAPAEEHTAAKRRKKAAGDEAAV